MKKVSIVLPVYNVSQYLKECLDSVICQTLKDIEIICVNDGSTDDSLDIINEYAKMIDENGYIFDLKDYVNDETVKKLIPNKILVIKREDILNLSV
jgi:glycosyltransferase involved in cell wall biosynthesis